MAKTGARGGGSKKDVSTLTRKRSWEWGGKGKASGPGGVSRGKTRQRTGGKKK